MRDILRKLFEDEEVSDWLVARDPEENRRISAVNIENALMYQCFSSHSLAQHRAKDYKNISDNYFIANRICRNYVLGTITGESLPAVFAREKSARGPRPLTRRFVVDLNDPCNFVQFAWFEDGTFMVATTTFSEYGPVKTDVLWLDHAPAKEKRVTKVINRLIVEREYSPDFNAVIPGNQTSTPSSAMTNNDALNIIDPLTGKQVLSSDTSSLIHTQRNNTQGNGGGDDGDDFLGNLPHSMEGWNQLVRKFQTIEQGDGLVRCKIFGEGGRSLCNDTTVIRGYDFHVPKSEMARISKVMLDSLGLSILLPWNVSPFGKSSNSRATIAMLMNHGHSGNSDQFEGKHYSPFVEVLDDQHATTIEEEYASVHPFKVWNIDPHNKNHDHQQLLGNTKATRQEHEQLEDIDVSAQFFGGANSSGPIPNTPCGAITEMFDRKFMPKQPNASPAPTSSDLPGLNSLPETASVEVGIKRGMAESDILDDSNSKKQRLLARNTLLDAESEHQSSSLSYLNEVELTARPGPGLVPGMSSMANTNELAMNLPRFPSLASRALGMAGAVGNNGNMSTNTNPINYNDTMTHSMSPPGIPASSRFAGNGSKAGVPPPVLGRVVSPLPGSSLTPSVGLGVAGYPTMGEPSNGLVFSDPRDMMPPNHMQSPTRTGSYIHPLYTNQQLPAFGTNSQGFDPTNVSTAPSLTNFMQGDSLSQGRRTQSYSSDAAYYESTENVDGGNVMVQSSSFGNLSHSVLPPAINGGGLGSLTPQRGLNMYSMLNNSKTNSILHSILQQPRGTNSSLSSGYGADTLSQEDLLSKLQREESYSQRSYGFDFNDTLMQHDDSPQQQQQLQQQQQHQHQQQQQLQQQQQQQQQRMMNYGMGMNLGMNPLNNMNAARKGQPPLMPNNLANNHLGANGLNRVPTPNGLNNSLKPLLGSGNGAGVSGLPPNPVPGLSNNVLGRGSTMSPSPISSPFHPVNQSMNYYQNNTKSPNPSSSDIRPNAMGYSSDPSTGNQRESDKAAMMAPGVGSTPPSQQLEENPDPNEGGGAGGGGAGSDGENVVMLDEDGGRKMFRCVHCQVDFSAKSNLRRHIRMVHEKLKTHTCDACGESFVQFSGLKRHFYRFHKETADQLVEAENRKKQQNQAQA